MKLNRKAILNILLGLSLIVSTAHGNESTKSPQEIVTKRLMSDIHFLVINQFYKFRLSCAGIHSEVSPIPKTRPLNCTKSENKRLNKIVSSKDLDEFVKFEESRILDVCKRKSKGREGESEHCTSENYSISYKKIFDFIELYTQGVIKKHEQSVVNNAKHMMSFFWQCPRDLPIYKCHLAVNNYITKYKKKPANFSGQPNQEFDLTAHKVANGIGLTSTDFGKDSSFISSYRACTGDRELTGKYKELFQTTVLHQAHRNSYAGFWHCLNKLNSIHQRELSRIKEIITNDSGVRDLVKEHNDPKYRDHLEKEFFDQSLDHKLISVFTEKYPRVSLKVSPFPIRTLWRTPKLALVLRYYQGLSKALNLAEHSLILDLREIKSIFFNPRGYSSTLKYGNHAYGSWATGDAFNKNATERYKPITKGYRRALETFSVKNLTGDHRIKATKEQEIQADKIGFDLYEIMRSQMLKTNSLIVVDYLLGTGEKRINMSKEFSSKAEEFAHIKELYSWINQKDSLKYYVEGSGNHNRAELKAAGYRVGPIVGFIDPIRTLIHSTVESAHLFRWHPEQLEAYKLHEGFPVNKTTVAIEEEPPSVEIVEEEISLDDPVVEKESTTKEAQDGEVTANQTSAPVVSNDNISKLKTMVQKQFRDFSSLCMQVVPVGLNSSFSQENTRALYRECGKRLSEMKTECNTTKTSQCLRVQSLQNTSEEIKRLQRNISSAK